MRRAPRIALAPEEQRVLERWATDSSHGARRARRSRIVLGAAQGRTNAEIAAELATSPETVARWRSRFRVNGLEGMEREAPRAGDPRRVPPSLVAQILDASTDVRATPPGGWSTRSLARALHVNHMLVHRVWRAHGLRDGRPNEPPSETDPFASVDVVGMILTPELRAAVFSVLGTGGGPSPTPSGPGSFSEVSVAALAADPRAGPDIVLRRIRRLERIPRRRLAPAPSRVPLLVFLRTLERKVPDPARLDIVVDRRPDRIDPRTIAWLGAHPRFRLFAPTVGQSWSRAVEGWLHRWSLTPGRFESFRSVTALEKAFGGSSGRRGRGLDRLAWSRASS